MTHAGIVEGGLHVRLKKKKGAGKTQNIMEDRMSCISESKRNIWSDYRSVKLNGNIFEVPETLRQNNSSSSQVPCWFSSLVLQV